MLSIDLGALLCRAGFSNTASSNLRIRSNISSALLPGRMSAGMSRALLIRSTNDHLKNERDLQGSWLWPRCSWKRCRLWDSCLIRWDSRRRLRTSRLTFFRRLTRRVLWPLPGVQALHLPQRAIRARLGTIASELFRATESTRQGRSSPSLHHGDWDASVIPLHNLSSEMYATLDWREKKMRKMRTQ
jgi:hypothetical protein